MEQITIIIDGAPYGSETVWNGIRLARALISTKNSVEIKLFLLGDAVGAAKKGQETPKGYYNLELMLRELLDRSVEILACGTCLRARGLNEADLLNGIKKGSMVLLAQWVKQSDKILNF